MLPQSKKLPSFCQSLDVTTKNADQCLKKKEEAWTVNYKLHQKSQRPLLWVAL